MIETYSYVVVFLDNGVSNNLLKELEGSHRKRLESTSLLRTPIDDTALQDFHQHKLAGEFNPLDLKYNLYAIVVCYLCFYLFWFIKDVNKKLSFFIPNYF